MMVIQLAPKELRYSDIQLIFWLNEVNGLIQMYCSISAEGSYK